MEISNTSDKKGLRIKFVSLYVLSIALIAFIVSVFIPRTGSTATITSAKPLESNDVQNVDLLNKLEILNTQYQTLKRQELEYLNKSASSANTNREELNTLQTNINESAKALSNKLDDMDIFSRSYSNQKAYKQLHNFTETFRLVMNDRNVMQAYQTSLVSNGNINTGQQDMLKLQSDIQARNSRIATLESQVKSLESKQTTTIATVKNPINNQTNNTDALQVTINAQSNKIETLTSTNANLEKELKANNDILDQLKKSSVTNSSAMAGQTSTFEKRINDMNAEIRFAQVDCNLARVDATQIISNAKQRKLLLADALNTLNSLSASGDASVKKKALDKMNRLNQIASTVRD